MLNEVQRRAKRRTMGVRLRFIRRQLNTLYDEALAYAGECGDDPHAVSRYMEISEAIGCVDSVINKTPED